VPEGDLSALVPVALMFGRFTQAARAVVVRSEQNARDTGSRRVDTRDLLLALVHDGGPAQWSPQRGVPVANRD